MSQQSLDLFDPAAVSLRQDPLAPGAAVLRGFARAAAADLVAQIGRIASAAAFRHLATPGGFKMSVAMTNCGRLGWVSDSRGYRYAACDPDGGAPWPAMPGAFSSLAADAALQCGYAAFAPDACLINRYEPGARLTLHQDRDERDLGAPIVSVSLGLPAVFLFGGDTRTGPIQRVPLVHGDVVVWGGPARMRYHGILPLKDGWHELTGSQRLNLTFRQTGIVDPRSSP